jgi:hypothetical protein
MATLGIREELHVTRGRMVVIVIRGVLVGFAVLFACYAFVAPAYMQLDGWLYRRGIADIQEVWLAGYSTVAHVVIGGTFSALAGFVVGITHRGHRRIVVPAFFALVLLNQSMESVPALVAAGLSAGAVSAWSKLALDLTFIRVPILLAGLLLVRDRE